MPANRSVRVAHLQQEPSDRCPFRCPAPATEAAAVHTGFLLRSVPLGRGGMHCAPPRTQSGGPRPGRAERDPWRFPLQTKLGAILAAMTGSELFSERAGRPGKVVGNHRGGVQPCTALCPR